MTLLRTKPWPGHLLKWLILTQIAFLQCYQQQHSTVTGTLSTTTHFVTMSQHHLITRPTAESIEQITRMRKSLVMTTLASIVTNSNDSSVAELPLSEIDIVNSQSVFTRMQARMTRSREAKWASVSFSFICILLICSVCYSKMWKDNRGSLSGQPLPLNLIQDRVPLSEVIRRRLRLFRQLEKRERKRTSSQPEDEILLLDLTQDV